jgi:acyl dehydratase
MTQVDPPTLDLDLPIGAVYRTRGRTLTRGECALLADLTWTIGSLHTDREFAKNHEFGDTFVAGAVLLAVAVGLINTSDHYRELQETHGIRVIAALGVDAKYRNPLFPGNTITVETRIEGARESKSRPGEGILTFEDRVLNQDEVVLLEMKRAWRFSRRIASSDGDR